MVVRLWGARKWLQVLVEVMVGVAGDVRASPRTGDANELVWKKGAALLSGLVPSLPTPRHATYRLLGL